jgi:uncharacterized membrane protein (DUF485 family)
LSAPGDQAVEAEPFAALDDQDWTAIESSPEFARLIAERRRVVIPSLIVFALWFGAFTVLAAWDHHWMASEIFSGFSVAYAAALSLIVMTWVLTAVYIRASNRRIDPLAEGVRRLAEARERSTSGASGASPAPAAGQVRR